MSNSVVIVDAVRSPMARSKNGAFRHLRAENLSAHVVDALLQRNQAVNPADVSDVLWGCVNQTEEQGWNVGCVVVWLTDLPHTTAAQTINRLCGSAMSAVHSAEHAIKSGYGEIMIAGGVEHMGHLPMTKGVDPNPTASLFVARAAGMMGLTAEALSMLYQIDRQRQDEFAAASHQKAHQAQMNGYFDNEIISMPAHDENGVPFMLGKDNTIRPDTTAELLGGLRPAFDPANGTVTAGNSSQVTDGASALLLMSESRAKDLGLSARARIRSSAVVGLNPSIMGYGPVPASELALKRAGLSWRDIDYIELNEAFAAQSLAVIQGLGLSEQQNATINPWGGAIALGHPLGCSGARIITTLMNVLEVNDASMGLATMCIGMGQGITTIIERVN